MHQRQRNIVLPFGAGLGFQNPGGGDEISQLGQAGQRPLRPDADSQQQQNPEDGFQAAAGTRIKDVAPQTGARSPCFRPEAGSIRRPPGHAEVRPRRGPESTYPHHLEGVNARHANPSGPRPDRSCPLRSRTLSFRDSRRRDRRHGDRHPRSCRAAPPRRGPAVW